MRVSVITVNYNDKEGLLKTIESVKAQSFKDYEFIIIDGGSTDGSVAIIEENKQFLTYWVSEKDRGIYHAMNKGVACAKGEYCIFMNSGDVFAHSESISTVFTTAKGADLICGNTLLPGRVAPPDEVTFDFLFHKSICHQCAFIKTELLKTHPYDEGFRIVSDRKFFLQVLILDNCTYERVNVDVVYYDINGFSSKNRTLSELEYLEVLRSMFPQRILTDYRNKEMGCLCNDDDYDNFYHFLKQYKYSTFIYNFNVLLIRLLSVFKKSASFAKEFSLIKKFK